MLHQTTYIITAETTPFPAQPSQHQLDLAAAQARQIALQVVANMPDDHPAYPETLSLGGRSYRFIQGNLNTNHEVFAGKPPAHWPQMSIQFWSQNIGAAKTEPVPDEVLHNCWNHTDSLITLALEHHDTHRLRPYPQMIITPADDCQHHMGYPDTDVFDDPAPGGTVALYLKGDPATSHHRAIQALRDIDAAFFRRDYLQTLASFPGHIVMEMDWNLQQHTKAQTLPGVTQLPSRKNISNPDRPLSYPEFLEWKRQSLTDKGEPLPFLTEQPRPWTHGACAHCGQPLPKTAPACATCNNRLCTGCNRTHTSTSRFVTDRFRCPVQRFITN